MTRAINIAQSGGNNFTMRNRIINGDMRIDQRNAGAAVTPTTSGTWYGVDRWQAPVTQSSKFTLQQSTDTPVGFRNSLKVTSTSAYSVTGNDYFALLQQIEGYNVADLGFGTANAATVTLSFWVKSSLTGSFGASLENYAQNRCYSFAYTVNAANTWEYKTVTIAGDTMGTWYTDNLGGMLIWFGLGASGTRVGTAGAWGTQSGAGLQPSGTVSVVGTNGATFYITGVQIEAGTAATPFENRPYGMELALCHRYYYRMKAATNYANFGMGRAYSTTGAAVVIELPVPMRAVPTGSSSSWSNFNTSGTVTTVVSLDPVNQYDQNYRRISINIVGTFASGQAIAFNAENTTAAELSWSAEL